MDANNAWTVASWSQDIVIQTKHDRIKSRGSGQIDDAVITDAISARS